MLLPPVRKKLSTSSFLVRPGSDDGDHCSPALQKKAVFIPKMRPQHVPPSSALSCHSTVFSSLKAAQLVHIIIETSWDAECWKWTEGRVALSWMLRWKSFLEAFSEGDKSKIFTVLQVSSPAWGLQLWGSRFPPLAPRTRHSSCLWPAAKPPGREMTLPPFVSRPFYAHELVEKVLGQSLCSWEIWP